MMNKDLLFFVFCLSMGCYLNGSDKNDSINNLLKEGDVNIGEHSSFISKYCHRAPTSFYMIQAKLSYLEALELAVGTSRFNEVLKKIYLCDLLPEESEKLQSIKEKHKRHTQHKG